MLPGVYGGPVFMRTPDERHWQVLWNAVNKFSNINILGNPFLPQIGSPDAARRVMSTQVLDLTPGIGQILKGFRKGHRANLKAASRKGVEIGVASSIRDVDAYVDVYQNALARWGQKAGGYYPRQLFHNLFRAPEYGSAIKLWLAFHQGRVIAGGWFFYHNVHAVYWHGALHSNYMSYHPVHLLVTAAIKESSQAGYRWFDFNPSGGLPGVEHFKSGFGTQRLQFTTYRRLNPVGKAFRVYRYFKESYLRQCSL
jgi:lipid II:glycine glycyltransferase (peptidoglycan interpeptide bridge formation enzyme)